MGRSSWNRTARQAWLAEIRERHGVTHRQLADGLGVAHSTLSRWATGVDCADLDRERIEDTAHRVSPLPF